MPQSNLPVISGDDCGICRRAIVEAHSVAKAQPPGYGDWIELFPSFAHLEVSAASCNLCRIIRQEIVYSLANLEDLQDCIYPVQVCWQLSDGDYSRSTLKFQVVLTHRGWCEASLETPHPLEAAGEIIPNFKEEAHFDSVVKTVHWWLRTCKDGHSSCRLPLPARYQSTAALEDHPPPLPTHVIDVRPPQRHGQNQELEERVPYVHLVEGDSRQGEYVTLSYCWGTSGKNFKTTSSNLAQQLSEIPWARLPQTIQDAVVVTRKLGIRYLWVDALCIIQARYTGDATSDWPVEATRMGQYYENATCTLAASSSHDCADEMLADRPAQRFGPSRDVTIDFDDVFLGKSTQIQLVGLRGPPIEAAMEESHLLSRGWCVQERALSRRMLYFARDALFWECNELRAGEHSPSKNLGFVPRPKTHALLHTQSWRSVVGQWDLLGAGLRNLVRDHHGTAEGLSASDVELILGPAWMGLIERYSACAFTNYSDRLVALSSVTEKLRRMTGASNVAGHWRETFGRSLSWMALSPTRTREACNDPGFPSWAWPSVDLGVTFEGLDGVWLESMTVEDIRRDPTRTDNVHAGHILRINGMFCEMPLAQWGLKDSRKGSGTTYTTSSFVESVTWDHIPAAFDANRLMACLFIGSVRESGYVSDTIGLVVQRTGRFDGDGGHVEEFERVGLLRFENLDIKGLLGAVRRTIDIA
ncbi:hypothetical protein CSHISOI_06130 [Colletotrichum shisoi]|uniref:Heterokaryon incompatibility domain-containing protein n=1 Tax=Colletotrichum shisoi TaxID=2078593 RepID=A0A5Q4BRN6_9PEZI|nr:hypothetical protein CSHISOI_06130 [Colletotrichum shisoi]